jgi:hypothetical protein
MMTKTEKSDLYSKAFDIEQKSRELSSLDCKIFELTSEKYQQYFLTSGEYLLYIVDRLMNSPNYRILRKSMFHFFLIFFVHFML